MRMQNTAPAATQTASDIAGLSAPQLIAIVQSKDAKIATLQHQLDWFKRQLFGQKSERFAPLPDPTQMYLGELAALPDTPARKHKVVPAHTRRVAQRDRAAEADAVPFFDEARVPIETIRT
jgi:transposase